MRRGSLVSLLLFVLPFVIDGWLAWAMPSNAGAVKSEKYALESDSPYSDLSSADSSITLFMEIDAPWEDFLMPSPVIISLLGQLLIISSKVDFSLTEYAPRGGFKYVRHPESFRSSLAQVTNEGWEAFMAAHENMDEIRLLMRQIPIQVRTIMKVLSKMSPAQAKSMLPIPLKKIKEMAQTSVNVAKETEAKFADLMFLTGELLEASVAGKQGYETDLAETQATLNATKEQKKIMDMLGEQLKNETAQMDAQVKKLRKDYEKALADIPHGIKAFFMGLFHLLSKIVTLGFLHGHHHNQGQGTGDESATQDQVMDFAKSFSMLIINQMFNDIGKMENQVDNYFHGKQMLGSPKDMITAFNVTLNTYADTLKGTECSVTKDGLGFIDTAKKIDNELDKLMEKMEPIDQVNQTSIIFQFDALLNSMKLLVAQAANGDVMYATEPIDNHDDDSGDIDDDSVGANERYKAHLIHKQLEHAEEERHQVFLQTMHYYDEMKVLVGKLAHLNLEEINFEQIVDLLKQGIKMLGKVREQWSKLVQFFSAVSARTEALMNQTMEPFLDYAAEAERIFGDGHQKDGKRFLNMLEEQANDVNKVSYFLYTLSSTYVDVSTDYLLDRLAYLPKLLSAKDNERQGLLQNLNKNLNETQDAIMKLAQQKRQDYDQLMKARQSEIEKVIDKLGGFDGNDTKIIDSALQGK